MEGIGKQIREARFFGMSLNIGLQAIFLLWIAFLLFFLPYPFYNIFLQAYKTKHYKPVPAIVTAHEIKSEYHSRTKGYGRHYDCEPIITYKFTLDGNVYESNKTLMTDFYMPHPSHQWAADILYKFPKGAKVTAYYDPANPKNSFLYREIAFYPYRFVLIDISIIFLFAAGFVACSYRSKPTESLADEPARWSLGKTHLLRVLAMNMAGLCAIYSAIGFLILSHYTSLASGLYDPGYARIYQGYMLLNLLPVGFLIFRTIFHSSNSA